MSFRRLSALILLLSIVGPAAGVHAQSLYESPLPHRYQPATNAQAERWTPNRWVAPPGSSQISPAGLFEPQRSPSQLSPADDRHPLPELLTSHPETGHSVDLPPAGVQPVSYGIPSSVGDHFDDISSYSGECWTHQILPEGLLYRSYIAGEKEPRFGVSWLYDRKDQWRWEVTLGARRGIWRNGTTSATNPEGWQLDIEGAAQPQLNPQESQDLDAVDYRFGLPLTYRRGPFALKMGYYHISSHAGDEYMERNPGFTRINYVRESLIFGAAYRFADDWQVYGEFGYAFAVSGGAKPWEIQFGLEYSPNTRGSHKGGPFAAANVHLREEVNWGGSINMLAGWQWMSNQNTGTLRTGFQFYNGKSMQYEFFENDEQMVGFGIWYDY